MNKDTGLKQITTFALRIVLASAFLSAVADRFGIWGKPGAPHVAWGGWPQFVAYTAKLNWFLPTVLIPPLAILATVLEVLLALGLLIGRWPRIMAFASAALLLLFALSMTLALGIKAPLDASVYTAAAAAALLGVNSDENRRMTTSPGDKSQPSRLPSQSGTVLC